MTSYSQADYNTKAPSTRGSAGMGITATGKRPLILVIEDDPGVMQVLLAVLALRNLNVLTATTIAEALNHWDLHKHELNMVLSDKWLSEYENTDDLLEWFNTSHPGLPVVLVTGSRLGWEEQELGKARKKLINKPFAVEELLGIVDFWTSKKD
jgi:DNA-binding NtrC family response regulator